MELVRAIPRIFVSYAWEDPEYREWVAWLATELRSDGVDVRLDQWHLERGLTIPEFMNREVRRADVVLVLCSPQYREKVHQMEERVRASGTGWEAMLVGAHLFTTGLWEKVEVALARGTWETAAPDFLLGLSYFDLRFAQSRQLEKVRDLAASLRGERKAAPPIGALGKLNPHLFDISSDEDRINELYPSQQDRGCRDTE